MLKIRSHPTRRKPQPLPGWLTVPADCGHPNAMWAVLALVAVAALAARGLDLLGSLPLVPTSLTEVLLLLVTIVAAHECIHAVPCCARLPQLALRVSGRPLSIALLVEGRLTRRSALVVTLLPLSLLTLLPWAALPAIEDPALRAIVLRLSLANLLVAALDALTVLLLAWQPSGSTLLHWDLGDSHFGRVIEERTDDDAIDNLAPRRFMPQTRDDPFAAADDPMALSGG